MLPRDSRHALLGPTEKEKREKANQEGADVLGGARQDSAPSLRSRESLSWGEDDLFRCVCRYVLYRYRNLGICHSLRTFQNLNACCEYGFQPESRVGQSFPPCGLLGSCLRRFQGGSWWSGWWARKGHARGGSQDQPSPGDTRMGPRGWAEDRSLPSP